MQSARLPRDGALWAALTLVGVVLASTEGRSKWQHRREADRRGLL
jgi:hypothetical protein